ncbi:hypothetical protein L6164_017265 [Bauhinia variegata]|uniref:Uncharacterized protein n=1 Tax=Bauhinia variegata TaxID=167791 RepID=A0ACB9N7K9_BAUVA|nr:hypothetical protein L6164_017265 [Bauhinia variegata]
MAPKRKVDDKGQRSSSRISSRRQGRNTNEGNANEGNPIQMPLALTYNHTEENQSLTNSSDPVEQFNKKVKLLDSLPRGNRFFPLLPFIFLSFIIFTYKGNGLFKFILPPHSHDMCFHPSQERKKSAKSPSSSRNDELDDEIIELGDPRYIFLDKLHGEHKDVVNVADSFNVQLASKKIGISRLYVPIDFSHPDMLLALGIWTIKIGESEWDVNMNCSSPKIAANKTRSKWEEFCIDNGIEDKDSIIFEIKLNSPRVLHATIEKEVKDDA